MDYSFIEDAAVIERILRHLGLWQVAARNGGAKQSDDCDAPKGTKGAPSTTSEITLDYSAADPPAARLSITESYLFQEP